MVWSRRRVIAVLQAPRTAGLVEAEGSEGKETAGKSQFQSCEKRLCRLKILSGGSSGHLRAVGRLRMSWFPRFCLVSSMPVTERDGNNGTRQGGRELGGRAAGQVRWCGRTWWDGCWTGWGELGSQESGTGACRGVGKRPGTRLQLQQQGGWGSRARCAGTAGAAGQSETVQPPLNLKVAC